MDSSQWKLVRELFDSVAELPPEVRPSYLTANCEDADVRRHVEELLAAQRNARGFLETPPSGAREGILQQLDRSQARIATGDLLKDRYRIVEKIGEGGFGDVYLARDEQLAGRKVVVKSLRKGQSGAAAWLSKRFHSEMEALSRIDHPGVAGVYDVGETVGGSPFLVMQYVPGGTLRDAMRAGPMPIARVARLASLIADALDAAHGVEVLHRDLKPENIILRDPGTPKESPVLIDFGIARVDAKVTTTTAHVAGSPMYMAPEQLLGRAVAASDQYAVALIVFELLAGKPLYEVETGRTPGEAADVVLRDLQPEITAKARLAIVRALSLEPAKRFEKTMDLATAMLPPTRRRMAALAWAACLGAFSVAAIFVGLRPGPEAEILYSVTRQTASGEIAVDPGTAVFRAGDKIRLQFSAAQDGYLYLLNEGNAPGGAAPPFVLLHASAIAAKAAATVPTGGHWMEFDSEPGTERLWMIWSRQPISQLESLRRFMNTKYQGAIADEAEARKLAVDAVSWLAAASTPVYNTGLAAVLLRTANDPITAKIELRHE